MCLEESFVRSMKLLGEMGMCFDLCMRPAELSDGARLADLCPDTRFVLDHCGNANVQWYSGPAADSEPTIQEARAVAPRSGRPRQAEERRLQDLGHHRASDPRMTGSRTILAPIVNHCLDAFGPDA
jgi:L-fuconolactonase